MEQRILDASPSHIFEGLLKQWHVMVNILWNIPQKCPILDPQFTTSSTGKIFAQRYSTSSWFYHDSFIFHILICYFYLFSSLTWLLKPWNVIISYLIKSLKFRIYDMFWWSLNSQPWDSFNFFLFISESAFCLCVSHNSMGWTTSHTPYTDSNPFHIVWSLALPVLCFSALSLVQ